VTGGATGGHHAPDEFVKHYRKYLPNMRDYIWSPANVEATVNGVVLKVEKGQIKIPRKWRILIRQMQDYRYHFNGYHIRYGACKGSHDDSVAALVQYVHSMNANWFSSTGVPLKSVLQL